MRLEEQLGVNPRDLETGKVIIITKEVIKAYFADKIFKIVE